MTFFLFILFWVTIGTKTGAAESDAPIAEKSQVFSKELSCFDGLVEVSRGQGFRIKPQQLVIQDHKQNRRGFYIFTAQTSYFCAFPPTPQKSYENSDVYFLKFKLPQDQVQYLRFSDFRGHPNESMFSWYENPEKEPEVVYKNIDCRSYLTNESRATIARVLRERMSTVIDRFEQDRKDPRESIPSKDGLTVRYFSALKECKDVAGQLGEETSKVLNEIQKNHPLAAPTGRLSPTGR